MEVDTQTNDKTFTLKVKGQNDRNIEIHIATKLTLGDLLQRIENALITDKYNMTPTLDEIIGLTDGNYQLEGLDLINYRISYKL